MVVTTNNETIPSQVPEKGLVSYSFGSDGTGFSYGALASDNQPNITYVATAVHNISGDLGEKMLALGNESITNIGDQKYYDAPLDRRYAYYTFFRAYADNHSPSVSNVWFKYCDVIFGYVTESQVHIKRPVRTNWLVHCKLKFWCNVVVLLPSGIGKTVLHYMSHGIHSKDMYFNFHSNSPLWKL